MKTVNDYFQEVKKTSDPNTHFKTQGKTDLYRDALSRLLFLWLNVADIISFVQKSLKVNLITGAKKASR